MNLASNEVTIYILINKMLGNAPNFFLIKI